MASIWRILSGLCLALFANHLNGADVSPSPRELCVVTYNVLADDDLVKERVPKLLEILKGTNADVIVLQEVAPWFADQLMKEPWAQTYHRPLKDGKPFIAREYLVLSRFPITGFEMAPLPGKQRRTFFSVTVELPGGPARFATCHLESFLQDGPIRAQQLDIYFQKLTGDFDAFFAGDFNFGDGEEPDTSHIDKAYRDAWRDVHPNKPGFTWDIEKSPMAKAGSFPNEPSRRLDKILFRSKRWKPVEAELLGTEPVSAKSNRVFPSDHFGLMVRFRESGN